MIIQEVFVIETMNNILVILSLKTGLLVPTVNRSVSSDRL